MIVPVILLATFILISYVLDRKHRRRKPGKVVKLDEKIQSSVHPDEPVNNFNDWSNKIIRH